MQLYVSYHVRCQKYNLPNSHCILLFGGPLLDKAAVVVYININIFIYIYMYLCRDNNTLTTFPIGSLSAMRFVAAVQEREKDGDRQVEHVSRELWRRIWNEDKDITEPASLSEVPTNPESTVCLALSQCYGAAWWNIKAKIIPICCCLLLNQIMILNCTVTFTLVFNTLF